MATIGYMEQLTKIIFTFDVFIKHEDGASEPFSLCVREPVQEEDVSCYCIVECPFIQDEGIKIIGVDAEQACKLSAEFIRNMLKDQPYCLVDDNGNEVSIPDIVLDRQLGPDASS